MDAPDLPDLLENLSKIMNGDRTLLEAAARIKREDYDHLSAEQRVLLRVEACNWARACLEVSGWDWACAEVNYLPTLHKPRKLQ